ncbi:MAG: inositol monophosphatase family protein [Acidobacteriota bacterium]
MTTELLATALRAAEAGADVVRRHFRAADLRVAEKAAHDFVSEADTGAEAAIVAEIHRRHPDHRILAEEGGAVAGEGGSRQSAPEWIIDPLDGTTNFLHGLPMCAVSVACRRGDRLEAGVILDPLRRETFTALRGGGAEWNGRPMRVSQRPSLDGAFLATGYPFKARRALDLYLDVFREVFLRAKAIRRCGAAALDLAYTAAGVFDGFFEFRLAPWDLAAGVLMVEEAGGRVSDLDGGPSYLETGNIVAGGAAAQPDLLAVVGSIADEAALERLDPTARTLPPSLNVKPSS